MRLAYRAIFSLVSIFIGGMLFPACASSSHPVIKTPLVVGPSPTNTTEVNRPENPGIPPEEIFPKSSPTAGLLFEPLSINAPNCDYGGAFKTIEAVDQYTVRFVLCRPEVAFLSKIAFPTFGIHSREWLEKVSSGGLSNPLLDNPVGTGPYIVREWAHGEKLMYKRFENYWGTGKARTSNLVFRWNLNSTDRLVELQAGTVDGIDNVSSTDFATVLADPDLVLVPRSPLSVSYLGINNAYPPFDNENVRRAIAMAIDRRKIVDSAFPMGYEVASHFTPCIIPNGCVGESWYVYDPARARELLVESGFPNGFQTELFYREVVRGYLPWPGLVAEEIRDQLWDNLKIIVKIRKLDELDFYNAVDSGTFPGLYLLGWGADFPDVTNFLDTHFGMNANGQFGEKFLDVVEALRNAVAMSDDESRRQFYETANNSIKIHAPMVPISYGGWISPDSLAVAYKSNVDGVHASPFGLETFSAVAISGQESFVWMQSAEPLSLYCADETDVETWRACAQVTETLYRFSIGGVTLEPALAELCHPNSDQSIWTCALRKNVMFHDGSLMDANDVVTSFALQWDASNPLHKVDTRQFAYFKEFWGGFLNSP